MRSSIGPSASCHLAGRRARCAGNPSTPPGTSAPGGTAITSTERGFPEPAWGRAAGQIEEARALEILADGAIQLVGRLYGSTNHAMYARVTLACPEPDESIVLDAIYKPTAGERPLDDFPEGTLTRREVAAFALSEATGWGIVPPTVLRDGPFGEGAVQQWIEADPGVDVVRLVIDDDPRLRRIAVFDAVVNNTDRKGGHLLPVDGGHVYGVDHGVCFSTVPKLRTVLWGWRGTPFDGDELDVLRAIRSALDGDLGRRLRMYLSTSEVAATSRRVDRLLRAGAFPHPSATWPAVPWPPF